MQFVRTIRTPTSERYLVRGDGKDVAALDLHFPNPGQAHGTLIILDHAVLEERDIHLLLAEIDETLLPDVSLDSGSLSFTVVQGRLIGDYEPTAA